MANPTLNYTQDEIASMVGSVREVVQRSLKGLEHAGFIEMERGRIRVIDVEAPSVWTSETWTRPSAAPAQAPR